MVQIYEKELILDSANQSEKVDVIGSSNVVLSIKGYFTGTIEAVGQAGPNSADGGRLLFKSGVGSIGRNKIIGDGSPFEREYRAIAGGRYFKLKTSADWSGKVTVKISTSESSNIIFVNGPVHDAEEEAVRDKRGFLASTGVQSVTAGNVIAATFNNPSDSNVNVFLKRRLFSNNRDMTDDNLEYRAFGNPTVDLANSENGLNLFGLTPFSVGEFNWEVDSNADIDMGGTEGSGEILPNGVPYSRNLDFIIPPGNGIGFLINGAGNNLVQAVRIGITLEWYEQTVN